MQYRCQHDQVVDCRHGGAVLPLVDCLRGGETENFLQVADGKACLLPRLVMFLPVASISIDGIAIIFFFLLLGGGILLVSSASILML